jgi:hypothetical protein
MRKISPDEYTGTRAWEAIDIEKISGSTTIRLHWTDKPYKWHINDGPEVFVVLDGQVNMHTRSEGEIVIYNLQAREIFHVEAGDEHVAHPVGAARILVIEREGSE